MGKILNAFVNDSLSIDSEIADDNPEYQKLCKKVYTLQEQLQDKLTEDEKELLSLLMNAMMDEEYCYAQHKFIRGYQLGVLMTTEIFAERDSFLT